MGSAAWGAGLQGLGTAIQTMFGERERQRLRQEDISRQDTRWARQDAQQDEQIDISRQTQADAAADREAAQASLDQERNRNFYSGMVDQYGGHVVPSALGAKIRGVLGDQAATPQQSLPSTKYQDSGGGGVEGRYDSPEPTGMDVITPTSSEKYRIALARVTSSASEGAADRASRETMNQARITARSNDNRFRQTLQQNALAMQKYGIDVRNEQVVRGLHQLFLYRTANLENAEFDNLANGGVLGIMSVIQNGGMPQAPELSMGNFSPYWSPQMGGQQGGALPGGPQPAPPGAPGASTGAPRFNIQRQ